jgi:hypothetical protein
MTHFDKVAFMDVMAFRRVKPTPITASRLVVLPFFQFLPSSFVAFAFPWTCLDHTSYYPDSDTYYAPVVV